MRDEVVRVAVLHFAICFCHPGGGERRFKVQRKQVRFEHMQDFQGCGRPFF